MTAIKAGDVDRAVARREPGVQVLLFYGPDAGRVAERARAAAAGSVEDPDDPFQLVRLDGDDVAAEPTRLVEEASTYGLFGQRRCISVRATGRNIAGAVAPCLEMALDDTLIVIEAGDLAKSAPLRTICERSERAYALPCYEDEARDLGAVVDEALRGAGLTIERDARALLTDSLGGDRLASRGELAKLLLFMHGRTRIEIGDILAAISDVSGISTDDGIDAAFGGQTAELDAALRQLWSHGVTPGTVLAMALRHALALLPARAQVEAGQSADAAVGAWRGLHFRRRAGVQRQLRGWTTARLIGVIARLQDATLQSRLSAGAAATLGARVLLEIAEAQSGRDAERAA